MKTKYLDSELERLNLLDINNELSDYGKEMLSELKEIKQALLITDVVHTLPSKEDIYVSHSNDGDDDVYCAWTDHSRGLKDCEEAGTLLTRITLYRD